MILGQESVSPVGMHLAVSIVLQRCPLFNWTKNLYTKSMHPVNGGYNLVSRVSCYIQIADSKRTLLQEK